MVRKLKLTAVSLAIAALPTQLHGASMNFNLHLQVPVYCEIVHQAGSARQSTSTDSAVELGTFREYCNAPAGYRLIVRYTPGSMRGALIEAGEDRVVLDGSGMAVLSQSSRPRVRERVIKASPGERGFDTDRLELQLTPA